MTYIASRESSSAFRNRTRPAMPARLNATARLSRTMTMMAATASGRSEMVVTSEWSTLWRSRVATYAHATGNIRRSAPTIETTAVSQ
jgi:hypothetical protein